MANVYDQDADNEQTPLSGKDLENREHPKAAISSADNTNATLADSAQEIESKEASAPDRSGFSAGDNIREKLGKGYTGKGSTKSKGLSKLYSSNSNLNKKVALAGAAAGGGVLASVLIFLALLPLKIEHIVTNLEQTFSATSTNALDNELQKGYSKWVTKNILPNLNKGTCFSTRSPGCVSVADNTTPVGKMFNAWRQGGLEQKLATDHGIIIGARGNTYYLNLHGHDYNIHSGDDIFNLPGTSTATRNEVRTAVRDGLRGETRYGSLYTRFKVGKLLEAKYGIKRCLFACSTRDKLTDSSLNIKLAAKALVLRNVLPQKYGLITQCILAGNCETHLAPSAAGDTERLSPFERGLQSQLADYAAKFGDTKLADLLAKSKDLSDNGIKKVMAREAAKSIVGLVAGDSAKLAAGEVAEKAAGPIGWAFFAARVVKLSATAGPLIAATSYALNKASAVELYSTYATVAAETKSGGSPAQELGTFNEALSTNLSGSSTDQVDATATPYYNYLNGGTTSSTASIFSSFMPASYAASTTTAYPCDNGQGVPAGKLVCKEENLYQGNDVANGISNFTNSIPGLTGTAGLITGVANFVEQPLGALLSIIPGLSTVTDYIGSQLSGVFSSFVSNVVVTPFTDNMSGGRIFDMMAAGADAALNDSCQITLGCSLISNLSVTNLRNQQVAEAKAQFDSQNMFARVFDTNSTYSLVSRLAMDLPTNSVTTAGTSTISMLSNPLTKMSSAFSSIFSTNHAFAATPVQADPFSIPQVGYTSVPNDPEAYFQQNCVNGPLATYDSSSGTLDVSAWLNSQTEAAGTGQAVATQNNPCLLINTMSQVAGGLMDSKLLPANSSNNTPIADTSGATTITGDAKSLATQVLANKNITFQTPSDKTDMENTRDGKPLSCTDSTGTYTLKNGIAASLMKVVLQLAQNNTYAISAVYSGHGGQGNGCSDGGRHPLGRAMDVATINGVVTNGDGCSTAGCRYHSTDNGVIQKFYTEALLDLPKGTKMGGIGQTECLSPAVPIPAGINAFADTCTHVHIDVGTVDAP
jgi:hypothetical protein